MNVHFCRWHFSVGLHTTHSNYETSINYLECNLIENTEKNPMRICAVHSRRATGKIASSKHFPQKFYVSHSGLLHWLPMFQRRSRLWQRSYTVTQVKHYFIGFANRSNFNPNNLWYGMGYAHNIPETIFPLFLVRDARAVRTHRKLVHLLSVGCHCRRSPVVGSRIVIHSFLTTSLNYSSHYMILFMLTQRG